MRIRSLDSVRGIGALIVVVGHCLLTTHHLPQWIFHFPFTLAVAGDGIVLVFFALSGFVLFQSFRDRAAFEYIPYLIKRFVRIYPPFVVAVLSSAVLFCLVRPHAIPGLSEWFNQSSWQVPLTTSVVIGHFALTDLRSLQGLDNVMWSLVQEMRISLIFPLLAFGVLMNWRLAVTVSFVISTLSIAIEPNPDGLSAFDSLQTLSYVFLFTAGAALAYKAELVRSALGGLPIWLQVGLWIGALRLVTVPVEQYYAVVTSAAALLIVALSVGTQVADGVLSLRLFRRLGDVSYSLYLVHLPIIVTFVHLWSGKLPLPLLLAAAVATALAVAQLMHRAVEAPAVALARRLASLPAVAWKVSLPQQLVRRMETP